MAVVYAGGAGLLDGLRAKLVRNFSCDLAELDGDTEGLRVEYIKKNPRYRYGIYAFAI